jgi:large subunit ribosomal protein L6
MKDNFLFLRGPEGQLSLDISFLTAQNLSSSEKKIKYSSFIRLFQKSILGVSLGFVIRLAFVGIGFRVESFEKGFIKLKLGFSHFVFIKVPAYIQVSVPKKTLLVFKCSDEQLLKEYCSKICSFKVPDAYKGKGIVYKNQILVLKEGKKK